MEQTDLERSTDIKDEINLLQTEVENLKRRTKERQSQIAKLWNEYYKINPKPKRTPAQKAYYQGRKPEDVLKAISNRKPNFDYE